MHFLLVRNEDEVFGQLATLLAALLDALSSDSERVVLQVGVVGVPLLCAAFCAQSTAT